MLDSGRTRIQKFRKIPGIIASRKCRYMFCYAFTSSCFLRNVLNPSTSAVNIYCYLTAATQKYFIKATTFDLIYADCRMNKNTRIMLTCEGLSKWRLPACFSRATNIRKIDITYRRSMASNPVGDCCKICIAMIVLRLFMIKIERTSFESITIILSTS